MKIGNELSREFVLSSPSSKSHTVVTTHALAIVCYAAIFECIMLLRTNSLDMACGCVKDADLKRNFTCTERDIDLRVYVRYLSHNDDFGQNSISKCEYDATN
uniref:Uncharacterized protein n=1 Tax=Glossina austeni TaxID=7395 RepID=A0A1A9VXG8_GLOAU